MTDKNEIPETWSITELGDISSAIQYGFTTKAVTQPVGPRFLRITDIQNNSVDWEHVPFCKIDGIDKDKYLLEQGDLLFARTGATVGKSYLIFGKIPESIFASYLIRVKIQSEIEPKYIAYFFKTTNYWKQISESSAGIGQPNVNGTKLSKIKVPVAPQNEQKRIVAEIEKQFSRLDEAVENLKRVKANLKRYKASVLKAAVEGKLTEDWRKANYDVEHADKLLEPILVERRKKWEEAELVKMKAKGKKLTGDKWKKKYKEPPQVDETLLPALPNGWAWANFERLAEDIPHALKAGPFGSSLKKLFYVPHGYKIYGQEQVLRNDPTYGDYYIDDDRYENLRSCAVKPGDILISLVGTIGKVLILPENIEPGIINPRLVKFSLDRRLVDANYIKMYLQSPYVKYLFSIASHGGTMDILNLTILKEIPIPVPPLEEQNKITEEFERISSIENDFISAIEINEKKSVRLRQSILKKAFSGNLIQNREP